MGEAFSINPDPELAEGEGSPYRYLTLWGKQCLSASGDSPKGFRWLGFSDAL
jgi:hypothetical protein